jgi:transposase-like protein
MLPASVISATVRPHCGTPTPPGERVATLATPQVTDGQGHARGFGGRELYVGEIRDAVMSEGLACPHCHGRRVVRYGKRKGVQRYRCRECGRTFTDFTGTVLHGLRRRDLWLDFCQCLMEGLSVRDAAERLGISKNTSFAWRHRAISALATADSHCMCKGLVELAQLPMLRSFKGSKVPPDARMDHLKPWVSRYHRVYGHLIPRPRLITLLVAVDRAGRTRAEVVPRGEILTPTLSRMAVSQAEVCVPGVGNRFRFGAGWPGGVRWIGGLRRRIGRVGGGPLYHVRNANRLIHDFVEWMRRFFGVATKYLLRYFSWHLRVAALAGSGSAAAPKLLFLAHFPQ